MMSFGLKKMDPYARFSHAGKQWSSDYINNGGKEPDWSKCNKYVWDLELALPPNEYQDNFYFSVMDSDMKRDDDTVGFGEVPLATLINYD
jgi:Ca2+-dependent lipid-binding protein